jgi:hypothetical protein
VATHAEYALGSACISKVFDFAFTVATTETCGTKRLLPSKDGQVFNLIAAGAAAICAVVADERSIAEK